MKKIAIIASGGDAVGINSAIAQIIRQATVEAWGFHGGYDGIIEQSPKVLAFADVQAALSSGHNLLRSARSKAPLTVEGRRAIRQRLRAFGVDTLVVFGGGGSSQAARLLDREGLPTIVLPMSIDNDISGTEYTLGFDSTLEVVTRALDQLHNTARNMEGRVFMLEVFGAAAGHIALAGALAGGAHAVLLPEFPQDIGGLCDRLRQCLAEPLGYGLVVCAEGYPLENAHFSGTQGVSIKMGKMIEERLGFKLRYSILGFCQRAPTPSVKDRLLAIALGQRALQGKKNLDPDLVAAARHLRMIN